MTRVFFHGTSDNPGWKLTYSVIAAIYKGQWLFVRHRDRSTWEIPGGHIEENESAYQAARRELSEETGALNFELHRVATYSVEKAGRTGYGMLYVAWINTLGDIPDKTEIEEILLSDDLPANLTYPDIQPLLFARVKEYIGR